MQRIPQQHVIETLRLLSLAVPGHALLLTVRVYTLTAGNKHRDAPYEVISTFVAGYVQEPIFESHKRLFLCFRPACFTCRGYRLDCASLRLTPPSCLRGHALATSNVLFLSGSLHPYLLGTRESCYSKNCAICSRETNRFLS